MTTKIVHSVSHHLKHMLVTLQRQINRLSLHSSKKISIITLISCFCALWAQHNGIGTSRQLVWEDIVSFGRTDFSSWRQVSWLHCTTSSRREVLVWDMMKSDTGEDTSQTTGIIRWSLCLWVTERNSVHNYQCFPNKLVVSTGHLQLDEPIRMFS